MSEESKTREEYQRARSAFDDLSVEERAIFLVEALASTLSQGIERVAKTVGDELDKVVNSCRERATTSKTTEESKGQDDYDPTNIPDA